MIWHPSIKPILHCNPCLHQLRRSPCLKALQLQQALVKTLPTIHCNVSNSCLWCRWDVRTTSTHSLLKDWHLPTIFAPIANLTAPIQELQTTPTRPPLKDWHHWSIGAPIQEKLIIAPSPCLKDLCPCRAVGASIQELQYNSRIPCLRRWQVFFYAPTLIDASIQELLYNTRTPCLRGWQVPFDAPPPPPSK